MELENYRMNEEFRLVLLEIIRIFRSDLIIKL